MFEIVKKTIDAWDPYGLLASHAPKDEFDSESASIAQRISPNSSVEHLASVISDVFSRAFFPEDFPYEKCLGVARMLREEIERSKTK